LYFSMGALIFGAPQHMTILRVKSIGLCAHQQSNPKIISHPTLQIPISPYQFREMGRGAITL